MEKFTELKTIVLQMEEDALKFFEKGNKAAGTRVRKSLQDIKVLAQEIRKEVQEKKTT
jgi:exonuclease VII small subunit